MRSNSELIRQRVSGIGPRNRQLSDHVATTTAEDLIVYGIRRELHLMLPIIFAHKAKSSRDQDIGTAAKLHGEGIHD
jgi:hypothetical protein